MSGTTKTTLAGSAVREVADLAERAHVIQDREIGGKTFVDRQMHQLQAVVQTPLPLEFLRLDAFTQYLNEGPDEDVTGEKVVVHVLDPIRVEAIGGLWGEDQSIRSTFARVLIKDSKGLSSIIDRWADLETFAIALQVQFASTDALDELRKFCAQIRQTEEVGTADDGVSQEVQAKSGVAAVLPTAVKNPWTLRPFRTFPEVEQPASQYVLRFRGGGDQAPTAALFQTDNDRWELEAVGHVADYLKEALAGTWTVLG